MLRQHFVFSGPIASGKTKIISSLVDNVKAQVPCYGFIERCIHKNGDRIGYDVFLNLQGKEERFPFVRRKSRNTFDGNLFSFDQNTIKSIEKELNEFKPKIKKHSLLYFDEFGNIEAKGRGLVEAMRLLMGKFEDEKIPYTAIFGARSQNLKGLYFEMKKFIKETNNVIKIPLKNQTERDVIEQILLSLKK